VANSNSKRIQTTVRLENSLYREFHKKCADDHRSQSAVITILIRAWLRGRVDLEQLVRVDSSSLDDIDIDTV
jgi:hypothetical protein